MATKLCRISSRFSPGFVSSPPVHGSRSISHSIVCPSCKVIKMGDDKYREGRLGYIHGHTRIRCIRVVRGVHPCNFHTETGLRVLCRRTRCMCTRARASSLPRYACVCFIRIYVRVIHRKTHARKIMHLHRIVCNDVSMCTCVWSSVVCGYMRIHVNAHTVTHGLAISHVGKCVKDVRTGLQNVSSRFVDETISLSLSLSLFP